MGKLSAAIFDMDGLLLDTEPLSKRAFHAACAEFGFEMDDAWFRKLIGTNRAAATEILRGVSPNFPAEAVLERENFLLRKIARDEGVSVKKGVFELFGWLEARKIKKALATSSNSGRAEEWLISAKLRGRFDAEIFGSMVERSKPAPDIFLAAAKALNAEPNECAVFEDSFNGVRAASSGGMMPFMIPDLVPPDEEILALCFAKADDLAACIPILEGLL